jgi:hypothetical protein
VSAYLQRPDICSAHIVHIKVNGILLAQTEICISMQRYPYVRLFPVKESGKGGLGGAS